MKINNFIAITSLSVFFSFSCESSKESQNIVNQDTTVVQKEAKTAKNINANEFNALMDENTIVLDVRRPAEFNSGHLKNAVNINYFDRSFVNQVKELDGSKKLLIYCASGGRSAGAMNKLKGSEFNKMYNLLGGISAWKRSGFTVVK